jgi:phage terminase small subunit
MRPKPPKSLSREAKKIWNGLADEMDVLDESAVLVLTLLCQTMDRRTIARTAIAKDGELYDDRFKQPKISPWVKIEKDCGLLVLKCYRTLGLDLEGDK